MLFYWHINIETPHAIIDYKLIAIKAVKHFCQNLFSNSLIIERILYFIYYFIFEIQFNSIYIFLEKTGETGQEKNGRFNWHKSCFNNPKKYSFCQRLSNHFHRVLCKNAPSTA